MTAGTKSSNQSPAISVIIPLYNKGPYITRTLNSVLSQTFTDFEVIVVDDGSTDDGATIVRDFKDQRIRLFQQENQGVSAARNKGVELAVAEFIAFLDADDEWLPNHIETLLQLKTEFPEAGAYATSFVFCDECSENHRKPKYREIPPPPWKGIIPDYFLSAALGQYPLSASSVAIKKEVFSNLGGFRIGAVYGEDADLWGRIAIHYPIAFSWEVGAIYHKDVKNRASEFGSLEMEPFVQSGQDAIRKNEVPPEMRENLIEFINSLELFRVGRLINAEKGEQAREVLRNCHTRFFKYRKKMLYIRSLIPYWLYRKIRKLKSRFKKKIKTK